MITFAYEIQTSKHRSKPNNRYCQRAIQYSELTVNKHMHHAPTCISNANTSIIVADEFTCNTSNAVHVWLQKLRVMLPQ